MKARPALFSGSWYPGTPEACKQEITAFLKDYDTAPISGQKWIGGIVPHAGWYFSGSIACNVISCLREDPPPDVIAIFGMHLHPGSPNYIMAEGNWETPFGDIQIESGLAGELIRQFAFQIETAENFSQDNTIELQLPFVKYFFREAKIVPIGVPPAEESLKIGEALAAISQSRGLRTKILGSTDLTHYGANYGFSPKGSGRKALDWVKNENDRKVIEAMLALDTRRVISEALASHNACCAGAAATALAAGKALGARRAETLAYASSYDKSPGDSFVGYVGIVF